MMNTFAIVATAGASRTAALSPAHTASPKRAHHSKHDRNWHTVTKSAFYANFYTVGEATGADIE
ncbi:MAG: hypothetical protein RLZ23_805 [Actinomycetota bacterium]